MATMRITRSRPQPTPTEQPAAEEQEQVHAEEPATRPVLRRAIRRFAGGVSTKPDSKSAARKAIEANLQLIAINNDEIDRIVRDNDLAIAQIENLMKSAGLTDVEYANLRAVYKEVFSRASRTVIVSKFKEKVTPEQFLEAVEVPVGSAQKFLGEKEMLDVCNYSAPKSQGFKVRVEAATKVSKTKPQGQEE